jgi:hypothetical protein
VLHMVRPGLGVVRLSWSSVIGAPAVGDGPAG